VLKKNSGKPAGRPRCCVCNVGGLIFSKVSHRPKIIPIVPRTDRDSGRYPPPRELVDDQEGEFTFGNAFFKGK